MPVYNGAGVRLRILVSWLRRADRSSISSFHLADLGRKVVQRSFLTFCFVSGAGLCHAASGIILG
jgi:hypothetical protein